MWCGFKKKEKSNEQGVDERDKTDSDSMSPSCRSMYTRRNKKAKKNEILLSTLQLSVFFLELVSNVCYIIYCFKHIQVSDTTVCFNGVILFFLCVQSRFCHSMFLNSCLNLEYEIALGVVTVFKHDPLGNVHFSDFIASHCC